MSAEEEKEKPKYDRRTWDKEAYAKKALEKLAALEAGEDVDKFDPTDKGIYKEAPAELPRVPGSERAFLQTREKGINFDARVGVMRVRAGPPTHPPVDAIVCVVMGVPLRLCASSVCVSVCMPVSHDMSAASPLPLPSPTHSHRSCRATRTLSRRAATTAPCVSATSRTLPPTSTTSTAKSVRPSVPVCLGVFT